MTQPTSAAPAKPHSLIWATVFVAVLLATGAALLWYGRSFYALDIGARFDHPAHHLLSPGAPIGHGYGVVGTALILTNLLYVVRRRLAWARLGSMRAWLNLHVSTGIFGTLLVAFHSAFQVRSANASWTMLALSVVVLTGLVGRFIFAFNILPDSERFHAHLAQFDTLAGGMGRQVQTSLGAVAPPPPHARIGFFRALLSLRAARRQARARRRIVLDVAKQFEAAHPGELHLMRWRVNECADIAAQQASAPYVDAVMRSWRGLHRFAAILMVLLVALHVSVAWVFGYRWIFSE